MFVRVKICILNSFEIIRLYLEIAFLKVGFRCLNQNLLTGRKHSIDIVSSSIRKKHPAKKKNRHLLRFYQSTKEHSVNMQFILVKKMLSLEWHSVSRPMIIAIYLCSKDQSVLLSNSYTIQRTAHPVSGMFSKVKLAAHR